MRRTSKKKSDIREKTLSQMRNLQKRFEEEHPQLLSRIRKEIYRQGLYDASNNETEKSEEQSNGEVSIDHRKNLETVMRFAHIHEGSADFQEKLKKILSSVKH